MMECADDGGVGSSFSGSRRFLTEEVLGLCWFLGQVLLDNQ